MKGQQSVETVLQVPAAVVWDAYRGLELGRLTDQLLGDVVGKVQVLEGDGGVGTLVQLTYPPGTPGIGYMKEIFTKMDDEKRVKETETVEGGLKEIGFDVCRIRLEIIDRDGKSSIIRSTVEYEMEDSKAGLASHVPLNQLQAMAEAIGKHLAEKQANI